MSGILLSGTVERDPELCGAGGRTVARFGLVVDREGLVDGVDNRDEALCVLGVVTAGSLGEQVAASFHEGDHVVITGQIGAGGGDGGESCEVEIVTGEYGAPLRLVHATITPGADCDDELSDGPSIVGSSGMSGVDSTPRWMSRGRQHVEMRDNASTMCKDDDGFQSAGGAATKSVQVGWVDRSH